MILEGDQCEPWREQSGSAETEDHVPYLPFEALLRSVEQWSATEGILLKETLPSYFRILQVRPMDRSSAGGLSLSVDSTGGLSFPDLLVRFLRFISVR